MNLTTTVHDFFVLLGAVALSGIFVWVGVCLYLAYTQVYEFLERLKHCSAVMSLAPLRQGGPWGILLLVGGVTSIVTFPRVYLKHGDVSVEDLINFPRKLKNNFAVLQWVGRGLIVGLLISAVAIKLIELGV
ncbi:hypothetical protein [Pseudomonas saponiphila]|uniref:hypothetical protein n=1 Tax=Pseudomonas saponiphila TaxID=556534 RepID=UPI000B842325|nr:hypothetical protein [Pseudomonas saponiphila]